MEGDSPFELVLQKSCPSTYTWSYLVLWDGFIQAGFLLRWISLWSFVKGLILLFLEYWELSTFPFLSSLFSWLCYGWIFDWSFSRVYFEFVDWSFWLFFRYLLLALFATFGLSWGEARLKENERSVIQ